MDVNIPAGAQITFPNGGTVTYVAGGRTQTLKVQPGDTVKSLANGQEGLVFVENGTPVPASAPLRAGARYEAYPTSGKLGVAVR